MNSKDGGNEAIREQAERHRAYVANAPLAIMVIDGSGRYVEVNPATCRISGYDEAELLAKSVFEVIADESRESGQHHLAEVKNTGHTTCELRWMRKNGSKRWSSCEVAKLLHDRFLVYCFDITDRKVAEESQRQSEYRQRAILDTIPDPAWLKDNEGRFLAVNTAWCRFIGMNAADVLGKTVFEFLPTDVAEEFWEQDRSVLQSRQPFHLEELLRDKDGRPIWFETIKNPLYNDHGEVVGTTGLARDITARKAAERELRESEKRYRAVVEDQTEVISRCQSDGTLLFVNDVYCRFFGKDHDDLLGRQWRPMVVPEDLPLIERQLRNLSPTNPVVLIESRVYTAAGDVRWMQFVNRGFFDEEGVLTEIQSVGRDITERKQAEEENLRLERRFLHAQKLESLGILAGGIAHDFNNILAGILGYADLTLMQLTATESARTNIEVIKKAVRRAADLTRQMLAYSGKGTFLIDAVSLSRVVTDIREMLEISISKKVVLKYDLAPDLPTIEADASQLHQLVLNLVVNASEAIGEQTGVITILTDTIQYSAVDCATVAGENDLRDGLYVRLEVTDTGCGMDERTLETIFDPFFTTKFTGRGLGLAAVQGIVRGHQGAIRVASELGKGTTFQVLLPVSDATLSFPSGESNAVKPWRGKGTVFIVDDEAMIRDLASQMIRHVGFAVLTANDGEEAVRLYRQRHKEIVCVILDLTMPKMNGEETFRALREVSPDVRVILSSGYSEEAATSQFSKLGLAGFIQKPYQLDTMIAKIREAVVDKRMPDLHSESVVPTEDAARRPD